MLSVVKNQIVSGNFEEDEAARMRRDKRLARMARRKT
jgi:hypothetical protein